VRFAQGAVPTVNDDFKQRGLREVVVLSPQRRHRPSTLHRKGADGEDRRLTPRHVAFLASAEVGVAHDRAAVSGGRRTGSGLDHRQLPSSADRPLMERELCIFEMSDTANPISLARSRLLQERLLKLQLDLQADKSCHSQGTLLPSSVNPRYRIRGTNVMKESI
jgi:hypothetical protein